MAWAVTATSEILSVRGRDPKVHSDIKTACTMLTAGTVGYILEPIRTRDMTADIRQIQTGIVDAFCYAIQSTVGKQMQFDSALQVANITESLILETFTHYMPWLDNEDVFIDSYVVDLSTYSVTINISDIGMCYAGYV